MAFGNNVLQCQFMWLFVLLLSAYALVDNAKRFDSLWRMLSFLICYCYFFYLIKTYVSTKNRLTFTIFSSSLLALTHQVVVV